MLFNQQKWFANRFSAVVFLNFSNLILDPHYPGYLFCSILFVPVCQLVVLKYFIKFEIISVR